MFAQYSLWSSDARGIPFLEKVRQTRTPRHQAAATADVDSPRASLDFWVMAASAEGWVERNEAGAAPPPHDANLRGAEMAQRSSRRLWRRQNYLSVDRISTG